MDKTAANPGDIPGEIISSTTLFYYARNPMSIRTYFLKVLVLFIKENKHYFNKCQIYSKVVIFISTFRFNGFGRSSFISP